jgi:hypothetical protein
VVDILTKSSLKLQQGYPLGFHIFEHAYLRCWQIKNDKFITNLCYVTHYFQARQGFESQFPFVNHAMNPNGKWCIIDINLLSDLNFGSLECTYPISLKTKNLLAIDSRRNPPHFCKASMITITKLSTLVS